MPVPFCVAVDVGNTRTAVAVSQPSADGEPRTASVRLGRATDTAPSTVFVADGGLLFGDAAERRGLARPDRLIREFRRRVGDDVPFLAGDRRLSAADVHAQFVTWAVGVASDLAGSSPAAIAVTVPATWGEHRRGLVRDALVREGWSDVELIGEPEAAARQYEATTPLEAGQALAVYDLGGGTFDAVVLCKTASGALDVVGEPAGLADLGGADFDDAVFRHVLSVAGLTHLADPARALDPGTRIALASLRRECTEAKEALSFDTEAEVPVLAGPTPSTVRLTRAEFERMIEPAVARTVDVFARMLESTDLPPDALTAILLTGGSSRVPRIAQLLSERFDRPVATDADPKAIVALGAARAVAEEHLRRTSPAVPAAPDEEPAEEPPAAFDPPAPRRRWFHRLRGDFASEETLVPAAGGPESSSPDGPAARPSRELRTS